MEKKILIALSLYITSLIASSTLGIKLMPVVFGTHLSTAIFTFPIVFLTTDVIGEVYGKPLARTFVRMGFYALILFLGFNWLSNIMPSSLDFFLLIFSFHSRLNCRFFNRRIPGCFFFFLPQGKTGRPTILAQVKFVQFLGSTN